MADAIGLVNRCPNPSAEINATDGVTSVDGGAVDRATWAAGQAFVGATDASFRLIASGATYVQFSMDFSVVPGAPFSVAARFRLQSAGLDARMPVRFLNGGGGTIQTVNGPVVSGLTTAGWAAGVHAGLTVPAGAATARVWFRVNTTASGQVGYVDGIQVLDLSFVPAYFDGDSARAKWLGTPHASSSMLTGGEQVILSPGQTDELFTDGYLTAQRYKLLEHDYTPPEPDTMWVSSVDSEGEEVGNQRYPNRTISQRWRVYGATPTEYEDRVQALVAKAAQLTRDGGELKRVMASGREITFDVLRAIVKLPADRRAQVRLVGDVELSFTCRPFGRGATVAGTTQASTDSVVVLAEQIQGDVPALGRVTVGAATDQRQVVIGAQTPAEVDTAATAALYVQAESLTPLNGAQVLPDASAASGSAVFVSALASQPVQVLSSRVGTTDQTHRGTFRMFARVRAQSDFSVRAEWGAGDALNIERNRIVSFGAGQRNQWQIADLGIVYTQASGRWRYWIAVLGSAVQIDWLALVPTASYADVRGMREEDPAGGFGGASEFLAPGSLNGTPGQAGGDWETSGGTPDFAGPGGETGRSSGTERTGRLGPVFVRTVARVRVARGAGSGSVAAGLVFRYVDANNFGAIWFLSSGNDARLVVSRRIAGSNTQMFIGTHPLHDGSPAPLWLRVEVDRYGLVRASMDTGGPEPRAELWATAQHDAFAEGGALAAGRAGIYDGSASGTTATRSWGMFSCWGGEPDMAIYGGQSTAFEQTSTGARVTRTSRDGTRQSRVETYEGSLPLLSPGPARLLVKAQRTPRNEGPDALDSITATLSHTPRWLALPR